MAEEPEAEFESGFSLGVIEVVKAWQKLPDLCRTAASCKLAMVGDGPLTRADVAINSKILGPLIKHLGS